MVQETIARLTADAEQIRNTDPVDLSTMEQGDEHRQGDLRIVRLSDGFTKLQAAELARIAKPDRQLAPGTTQGSRHELASLDGITMFRMKHGTALDGPLLHAEQPFSILHPEHGDCVNLPAGDYAFPGQRAYAEELRRVAD